MQILIRIFTGLALLAVTLVALSGCADEPAVSPAKDAIGTNKTFGAGKIKISGYLADLFYVIDNNIFLCTPIEEPRTPGAVLDAIGAADQTWSVTAMPLSNGARTVRYPVFADVRTPHGERRVLLPATLKVKVDVKAGEVLHSNDPLVFDITAKRSIKAGESFSVLFINGKNNTPSILSVETANGGPFFTAFLRSDNPDARRAAIEAWEIERDHAN